MTRGWRVRLDSESSFTVELHCCSHALYTRPLERRLVVSPVSGLPVKAQEPAGSGDTWQVITSQLVGGGPVWEVARDLANMAPVCKLFLYAPIASSSILQSCRSNTHLQAHGAVRLRGPGEENQASRAHRSRWVPRRRGVQASAAAGLPRARPGLRIGCGSRRPCPQVCVRCVLLRSQAPRSQGPSRS